MASAEKLYGAPAAQTDVLAEQATPLPAPVNSNSPLSVLQSDTPRLNPISVLPLELMEVVFYLALPSLDIMAWEWDVRACHPYMAALYILRRVSTMWKHIVDGTPSLWVAICASFPENEIRTSLVRSGSSPLVIYFPGPSWSTTPTFREFLPFIEPHLHRCSSLTLRTDSELVDSVPSLSTRSLVALKICIDVDSEWPPKDVIPFTREIEISDEALENIRAVDLTQVPMDWARVLEHLKDLRTLALDGVYDDSITLEQILSVLAASSSIEAISIFDLEIKDPPSSLCPTMESITLPHLRSIYLMVDGALVNGLLCRIRPPPEMIKFDITPTDLPPQIVTSFWQETLVPWIPVVQRLYQSSDEPAVRLIHHLGCSLATHSGNHLFIGFQGLSVTAALQWIQKVISPVTDVDNGCLHVWTHGPVLEDEGVLAILQTMRGLTGVSVEPVNDHTQPSLVALLNMLGESTTDSFSTPDPRPTFLSLRKLTLRSWRWNLDSIMDMLQRRYSMRSTRGQQVTDLTLDMSSLRSGQPPWRERAIISFHNAKALRGLDGVKEVRMGCVTGDSGILAVIWDEVESLPAWG